MDKIAIRKEDYARLARILRKVYFLTNLTMGQLEQIIPRIFMVECKAGHKVIKQGDAGDALFMVAEGRLSVHVKNGFFSLSRKVGELVPEDFFGEMALLGREPRTATVLCEEDSKVFVLQAADFNFVLKSNPDFAHAMEEVALERKLHNAQ